MNAHVRTLDRRNPYFSKGEVVIVDTGALRFRAVIVDTDVAPGQIKVKSLPDHDDEMGYEVIIMTSEVH